jgi:flagellar hook assembly protein FlgD
MQIRYGVTKPTKIRLEVYNVLGERVKTLVNEEKPIGTYSITWDGKADNGKRVSAGIYITKLTQAEKTKTYKLIIAK